MLPVDSDTGKTIYSKVSGYQSLLSDAESITMDSTFVLVSCTKIITAIAALQYVERGPITLDEPTDKILPELAELPIIVTETKTATHNPNAMDASTDVKFSVRPVETKITVHQLLTHTPGVSYDMMDPRLQVWRNLEARVSRA